MKPAWMVNSRARKLPADSPVICPDCYGKRSVAAAALDRCANPNCVVHRYCAECHKLNGPCILHACPRCLGTGLVCPACHGDRIVLEMDWDTSRTTVKPVRCERCCEGNQINVKKDKDAVERWIRKYVPEAKQTQLEVVK